MILYRRTTFLLRPGVARSNTKRQTRRSRAGIPASNQVSRDCIERRLWTSPDQGYRVCSSAASSFLWSWHWTSASSWVPPSWVVDHELSHSSESVSATASLPDEPPGSRLVVHVPTRLEKLLGTIWDMYAVTTSPHVTPKALSKHVMSSSWRL
jgi:hypothetical protein